jgi:hypothetical protein
MISTATPPTGSFAHQEFIDMTQALSESYTESTENISKVITAFEGFDAPTSMPTLPAIREVVQWLQFTKPGMLFRLQELNGSYYEDPNSLLHQLYQQGSAGKKKFSKACAERDALQRTLEKINLLLNVGDRICTALRAQEIPTAIPTDPDFQLLPQILLNLGEEYKETSDCITFINKLNIWKEQEDSIESRLAYAKIFACFIRQKPQIDSINGLHCIWKRRWHNIKLEQCSLSTTQILKTSSLIKKIIENDSFKISDELKNYILEKLDKRKPLACIFPNAKKPVSLDVATTPQGDYFFYMTSLQEEIIGEIFLRCVSANDFQGLMRLAATCKWFYQEIIGPKSQKQGFIEQLNFSDWHHCRLPNLKVSTDIKLPVCLFNDQLATIHKPTLVNAYKTLLLHHHSKTSLPLTLIIQSQKDFIKFFTKHAPHFPLTEAKANGFLSTSANEKLSFLHWSTTLGTRTHLLIPNDLMYLLDK